MYTELRQWSSFCWPRKHRTEADWPCTAASAACRDFKLARLPASWADTSTRRVLPFLGVTDFTLSTATCAYTVLPHFFFRPEDASGRGRFRFGN
jgi:hypothetical protein